MGDKAWLSYSWKDNEGPRQDDVDFLIQELGKAGVDVHYDRRDLVVGQPLWPQIEKKIGDPAECDAWVFLVTSASLSSKPCVEELLYAIDRALDKASPNFPLIGLVHGPRPQNMPAALRVRLWVSTDEPDWAGAVASGVRGTAKTTAARLVQPFHATLCKCAMGGRGDHVLQVSPRVGAWAPFTFGLTPADISKHVGETYAPPGCGGHTAGHVASALHEWQDAGRIWRGVQSPVVNAQQCAHIFLNLGGQKLSIAFGQRGGPIHTVDLQP